ncbi:hypothetical protein BB561_002821 [Smittium simulii]|uniref:RING-type domain-containing protein n=1 Tax=Smittium simulii TaxID=133385 RepID=A0A2T9YP38_9FUNG|nr:hypothetical protein BB561_002821 [Smittium simulii]
MSINPNNNIPQTSPQVNSSRTFFPEPTRIPSHIVSHNNAFIQQNSNSNQPSAQANSPQIPLVNFSDSNNSPQQPNSRPTSALAEILFTAFVICMPFMLVFLRPFISISDAVVPATESIINSIPLYQFKSSSTTDSPQPEFSLSQNQTPETHLSTLPKQNPSESSTFTISFIFKPFVSFYRFITKSSKSIFKSTSSKSSSPLPVLKLEYKDDCLCSICLSDYEDGDSLRLLLCNHHFHSECLDQWLKVNRICPLCKKDVVTNQNTEPPENSSAQQTNVAVIPHIHP